MNLPFLPLGIASCALLTLTIGIMPLAGRAQQLPKPQSTNKQPQTRKKKKLPPGAKGFEQYAGRDASDKLLTGSTRGLPTAAAAAAYVRGLKDYKSERYDEAAAQFAQAAQLAPDSGEAHYALGLAYAKLDWQDKAVAEFQLALKDETDGIQRLWAYYGLGNALADSGEYKQAIAAYRQAIKIKPQLSKPRYNFALAYLGAGEKEQALTEFREAVRLNPAFAEARYNLGLLALESGDRQEAELQHQQLVQLKSAYAAKLESVLAK